jgi:hypothetical protein
MAAIELLPRTFDPKAGVVVAYIQDDRPDPAAPGGYHLSIHAFYAAVILDIDATIVAKVAQVNSESTTIIERIRAAGWLS